MLACIVNVIARRTLKAFWDRNPQARPALEAWYAVASRAEWKSPHDVKQAFPTADFVADNRAIFNIAHNRYRLIVHFAYPYGRALIKFVGTHKDYDAIDPEAV